MMMMMMCFLFVIIRKRKIYLGGGKKGECNLKLSEERRMVGLIGDVYQLKFL